MEIGKKVYHEKVYNGHEQFEVVGIRRAKKKMSSDPDKMEVELEGDWSGGTHAVCQRGWIDSDGLLDERAD